MIEEIQHRKMAYLIVACIIVTIFLAITASILQTQKSPKSSKNQITPTNIPLTGSIVESSQIKTPDESKVYEETTKKISKEMEPILSKEQVIGRLIDFMPYKGTNFTMDFDYKQTQYIVVIPKVREQQGNQEFDTFLKSHNIEDRNWFRSTLLSIIVQ